MAQGSAGARFRRLVDDYYTAWLRFHPGLAVDAGVPGHEARLEPHGDDDVGALLALNDKLLEALDEIDPADLDEDAALDWRVVQGGAHLENLSLRDQDWRYRDPVRYLPVTALYQLSVRPVADAAAALAGRLAQVPASLREARMRLGSRPEGVPPSWAESAAVEAEQGLRYLRALHAAAPVTGSADAPRLHQLIDEAIAALEGYARFLGHDVLRRAGGDAGCGAAMFEQILRYRHFLDVTPAALHRFGVALFQRTRVAAEAAAARVLPGAGFDAVLERLRSDVVPGDRLIAEYRERMLAARAFVRDHGLVSFPAREQLVVEETPAFLRHRIPFAAYVDPSPADPAQTGRYFVTPHGGVGSGPARAGIAATCVHEAWPGHHLQFVTANARSESRSLVRLCNPSATLYEGWALYCEGMMAEQGFLAGPEQDFLRLRDRLWRALRVQIDVEVHARGLSPERAAARLVESLGFGPREARGELNWYTRAPGVPMAYATGCALIEALREGVNGTAGPKAFHDRLLSCGSIALPLVIETRFGTRAWRAARERVFGPGD